MTTFDEALRADASHPCIQALLAHGEDLAADLPALAKAHRKRRGTQGQIIWAVLREPASGDPDLFADCFLALDRWVRAWNRKHLRLVST